MRRKDNSQALARGAIPTRSEEPILENVTDAPAEEMAELARRDEPTVSSAPMFSNYFFSALAGTTWYFQFFFYTMGETQMGRYKFSSWTLHMASIMIFSTLWGIALKEWKGAGLRTKCLVGLSLFVLVASTVIVGYGNYLGATAPAKKSVTIRTSSPRLLSSEPLKQIQEFVWRCVPESTVI